jgi:hypothetical protein
MSRGPGYIQRNIFDLLRHTKKPMTFAEILACAYPRGSFEGDMAATLGGVNVGAVRSLRRALHKMVKDGVFITLGEGRPGDPYRYYFDPILLAITTKDKAEYEEMMRWRTERSANLGELLFEARGQMTDKEFNDWIESEFNISPEQAEQFITAHKKVRGELRT